jgi:proton glutamate symport protein
MKIPWGILVALVLAAVVGLAINANWSGGTWEALGVKDSAAFLAGKSPTFTDASGEVKNVNEPGVLAHAAKFVHEAAQFVGQLFVRALRVAAVPIVLFSIILGVASLGDPRKLGRLGARTLGLFLVTSVGAVTLGLVIANLFKPGLLVSSEARERLLAGGTKGFESALAAAGESRSIWQHLLSMVPTNPFEALAKGDMLQVIVVAVMTGGILAAMPIARTKPLLDACDVLNEVIGKVIALVMKLAPVAVFCLVCPVVAALGADVLHALGAYCLCVIGGLFSLLVVMYSPIVALLGRRSPLAFYRGLSPAMLVAFSSSSSNATLPVTLRCLIERLGVSPKIANFVCPVGATVNMDGTALYQGVAAVFIAQVMGVDLSLGQQVSIVMLATLAAIGSPGIPGGSLVFLIMVLQSVGVPGTGIALILGVDRLLDMCRTVVNITGDAVVAAAVDRMENGTRNPREI